MQRVVADRTRRTFLWSLIPSVIRVTPVYTKSTVRVVTTTLFSPTVNSCTTANDYTTGFKLFVEFSTQRFSLLVNGTKRSEICENGRGGILLPAFANCIAKVFTRTFVSFGNEIQLFRFWTRRQEFLQSATKRFDVLDSYTLTNVYCSKADINDVNWNSFPTSESWPADFRVDCLLHFPHVRELVLAHIFSACNCFMKYCRAEMVAGVTYTQFTSHKFAITDKLKRYEL